jgi:Chitobiase/beta-hexosaminidase C-terminal domain/Immunoglobulin domain
MQRAIVCKRYEIYCNDFEDYVGAEWSTNHRIQTPGGTRPQTWFLGGDINGYNLGFADDTVTLSLNNLGPHSWVEITFDLYIINTWDGIGLSGPDYFTLAVQGGPALLHTTFANYPYPQSYPADVGGGSYPTRAGALEVNSLGMNWPSIFGNTVYRITRRVQSSASSIQFQFIGGVNEPDGQNETWGLDNVIVSAGVPPPSIVSQPTNQVVLAGSNVLFAAAATGTQPLSYQWALNETNLPGETNYTLSLPNVSGLNAGFYTVVVTNVTGSVTSAPALLDVRYSLAYGNGERMLGSNYTFIGSVGLQLWSVFPNGNIFYTLDGSEPSFASTYYAGPFSLNRTATLRVIAYSADFLQAAEAPPIYLTVIPTYALNFISSGGGTVTFDPPAGPYLGAVPIAASPLSARLRERFGRDQNG